MQCEEVVSLRIRRIIASSSALLTLGLGLGACGHPDQTASRAAAPVSTATAGTDVLAVPLQSGYSHSEMFCARAPIVGTLDYVVHNTRASLKLQLRNLPSDSTIAVEWLNIVSGGYDLARFSTNSRGQAVGSSLWMYRPAEARGARVALTTATVSASQVGTLVPC